MPASCIDLLDDFRHSALDVHPDLTSYSDSEERFRKICHRWIQEKQPHVLMWSGREQKKYGQQIEDFDHFTLFQAYSVFAQAFSQPQLFAWRSQEPPLLVMPVPLGLHDVLLGSFKMVCYTADSMCSDCSGTGRVPQTGTCGLCKGQGVVLQEERVRYEVPPGCMAGNVSYIVGEGLYNKQFRARGDLLLVFQDEWPSHLVRDGAHLEMPASVDIWTLMLGGTAQVDDLLGNPIPFRVPPGLMDGAIVRIPGHGLPLMHRNGRGDLLLRLQARFPQMLEPHEQEMVRQLKKVRHVSPKLPVQHIGAYALIALEQGIESSDVEEQVVEFARHELELGHSLAMDLRSFEGGLPDYVAGILLTLYHKCQIKGRLPVVAPLSLQYELDQLQVAPLFDVYDDPSALSTLEARDSQKCDFGTSSQYGKWMVSVLGEGPLNSDILLDRTDYQQILAPGSDLFRVLDMSGVTMVDSYFVSLLVQLRRSLYAQGGQLALLGLKPLVRKVLQDTQVLSLVIELESLNALEN